MEANPTKLSMFIDILNLDETINILNLDKTHSSKSQRGELGKNDIRYVNMGQTKLDLYPLISFGSQQRGF